ncbi:MULTISPECIES: stage II sporulation protein M [Bacillales]|uniref:Stage II sporulation protein M n=1 Tax=Brevibacillus aydinogluensis TaxID=927786 RepID=A0AA48M7Z8_9BACL|nr:MULTISPECIES: stage II sporulation protein M [Bacillales]MBR8659253.1 stage II sporulation protein M [Brevibacillus sp. NL20B1]NNV02701.1 stage II sporulation protein M [Brevibacillus sp. MCWH]REK62312.1 MAG: stage II sporulation protein M [Brevibacillus sp.]MDT3415285.1 stage II sporulation protein M [Brevibacillus aydinogluensis]UFJ60378.1 stage II sporulation protein M [Anoxybacillus sediminis]
MRARVGQTIQAYAREHQSLYWFTIVLFAMGIIFGAVIVNSLPLSQRQELFGFLQYFFNTLGSQGIPEPTAHFQQAFGHYAKTVGILWMLGLSIIGLPMILLLLFLKGVVVGFTVGFLVNQLQWQGVTLALAGVLPQNLLVVPALFIVGVSGISFSMRLIKTRLLSRRDVILPHFVGYTVLVVVMLAVLMVAALFETFVSPRLMQMVLN